jgi:hypothetical protein
MSIAHLLLGAVKAATISPTTVSYTAAQFLNGFTGPISTTKNAARVYFRVQTTLWSGWITGTEAKWTMTSDFGDFDGAVQVAVDGGAFAGAARSGQVHTLFTGLANAMHFVEIRIADGLGDAAYMASSGNVLTVTGAPPSLLTYSTKVQVGANSSLGIYSGATTANSATYSPLLQAPKGETYGSNVGSFKIKGAFTQMMVSLNGNRKIGVSKNGGAVTFYTATDETDSPSRAMLIPCDGSTSTYNVWDDGNFKNNGGIFGVSVDSAFLDVGTLRRLDQYGDSVTFGSGPGATSVDTETMSVAAKLGFVGSTNGVSGLTITAAKAIFDNVLPNRVVASTDIGIIALGGNNANTGIGPTERSDYQILINKLLTKGYGKVFCRGILPSADPTGGPLITAANIQLKSVVDGMANANVIWIDTSTWTGWDSIDNAHPTAAGYVTIAGYAYPAYLPLI